MPKDVRVEGLAGLLGIPYVYALGVRASLRFTAEKRYPIGDFEGVVAQALADEMEYSGDAESLVAALVESGYLERTASGLRMPDWAESDPSWFGFSSWIRRNDREG